MNQNTKPLFLLVLVVSLIGSVVAVVVQQQERPSAGERPTTTLADLAAGYPGASIHEANELADAPVFCYDGFVTPKGSTSYRSGSVTVAGQVYTYTKNYPNDAGYRMYLVENASNGERSWAVIRVP